MMSSFKSVSLPITVDCQATVSHKVTKSTGFTGGWFVEKALILGFNFFSNRYRSLFRHISA